MTAAALAARVREAGVVGCGGAGFPTHVKYEKPVGLFVVNGLECEPMLKTDQHVMAHLAAPLVQAAEAVRAALGAEACVFGLKKTYTACHAALQAAAEKAGAAIRFALLNSVYPAGDEQVLLYEATGRVVPPGGLPLDAGAVVSNVGTLLAVHGALAGRPATHKWLTVAGEVKRPTVLRVPVGISFQDCIALAGGPAAEGCFAISGGPIMGRVVPPQRLAQEVVTKATSGILLLPQGHYLQSRSLIMDAHMKNRARAACIQCRLCTDYCPRSLVGSPLAPHLVMRAVGGADDMDALLESPAAQNAALCCECGVCEMFACPMELQPCQVNILLKREMRRRGIPSPKPPLGPVDPWREARLIPSRRMAARAGVGEYYDVAVQEYAEVESCPRVAIPLKQHIGQAALPVVRVGDTVRAGQLIGEIPPQALGARVHASIEGRVVAVDERVVIEGGEGL